MLNLISHDDRHLPSVLVVSSSKFPHFFTTNTDGVLCYTDDFHPFVYIFLRSPMVADLPLVFILFNDGFLSIGVTLFSCTGDSYAKILMTKGEQIGDCPILLTEYLAA